MEAYLWWSLNYKITLSAVMKSISVNAKEFLEIKLTNSIILCVVALIVGQL